MLQHIYWMTTLGSFHVVIFALAVPFLAVRSRARVMSTDLPPLDRMRHFRSAAFTLVLFATLSLLTARAQAIDVFRLNVARLPIAIGAGAVMYAVAVTAMKPQWRRAVERRTRIVHLFMPQSGVERAWWVLVAVLAGISEEITWRGVQVVLLDFVIGRTDAAIVVCALTFGIAHWVQGWKSSMVIVWFALGFHALVWLAGSLFVAMIVHTAYDITAGLSYGRLGRELGYTLDESPATPREGDAHVPEA